MGGGVDDIVRIGAGLADSASYDFQLLFQRQGTRILGMAVIDHVDQRFHLLAAVEFDVMMVLLVDHRRLFPGAQIFQHLRPDVPGDLIGDAPACAAVVEAEHETRSLLRTPMYPGIDAKRAMCTAQQRRFGALVIKSWVPHQRTVAKDPKIAHIDLSCVTAAAEIASCTGRFNGTPAAPVLQVALVGSVTGPEIARTRRECHPVSDIKTKPPKPTRRGYILLAGAIVLVIAGWSAAWFYGQSVLREQLDRQIVRMADQGLDVSCADLAIAGYPFRYEVSCADMRSADRWGTAASLGGLNAVALIYNPWHVIFEAKSPAAMSVPVNGLEGGLTWQTARASVKFSDNALGSFDAVIDKPEAAFDTALARGLFAAEKSEVHLRKQPDSAATLESFVTVQDLSLKSLPELQQTISLRSHARIEGGTALLAGADLVSLVRAQGGELPVELVLTEILLGAGKATASGNLVLSGDGTLSGSLELNLGNPDALLDSVKPLFPPEDQTFSLLQNVVKSLEPAAREVDGVRTITLPISVDRGVVRIGFLPLGQIPPLFPTGS